MTARAKIGYWLLAITFQGGWKTGAGLPDYIKCAGELKGN
jgi:hypothetical protein